MEKQTWRAFTLQGGCVQVTVEKAPDGTWAPVGWSSASRGPCWGDTPLEAVVESLAEAPLRVVEIVPPGELSRDEMRRANYGVELLRAEVEMLRGVGCREVDGGELRGPCGVCLKCKRYEGARELRLKLVAALRGSNRYDPQTRWIETFPLDEGDVL